ncbi:uncharacterized protein A1O9_12353 [Exophiala aquamarina CBS 119918]|uniref:Uncharacterized protein n=1 Tax=Exophiala aquamarina CBS 119918 TaxID=1182545 RepID=A0A072NXG5_9EURO|nr:uncharacterized protein A1O9_12353 [Exophiala aquamarina CBS 119918]KEF51718.1 hypothetical protein A1O9_12353 [Exophiala aquamarina CBS 119918]
MMKPDQNTLRTMSLDALNKSVAVNASGALPPNLGSITKLLSHQGRKDRNRLYSSFQHGR